MSTANITKAVALFGDPETRPTLSHFLCDEHNCMCAQGAILHHMSRVSCVRLREMDQHVADKKVARKLGISMFHSILIRKVNDSKDGCPEDAIRGEIDPEAGIRVVGPQAAEMFAWGRRLDRLTTDETERLDEPESDTPWVAAWVAARDAARISTREAASDTALEAAIDTASDAAAALLIRDKISQEQYDILTTPWRKVIGKLHPEDADLMEGGAA